MKSTPTKSKTSAKTASKAVNAPGAENRPDYVATAAYYKAEARGFEPGRELDDWLQAEAKFNTGEGH